jgi:hypothetical protein
MDHTADPVDRSVLLLRQIVNVVIFVDCLFDKSLDKMQLSLLVNRNGKGCEIYSPSVIASRRSI